jgi:hypothetical protein
LITGVKRDIALARQLPTFESVDANILYISLDKNWEALDAFLEAGSTVVYLFMVEGLGQYRFSDYVKIGMPLSLIIEAVALTLIPMFWEF